MSCKQGCAGVPLEEVSKMRTNWIRSEIAALFNLPFTELVFRAAEVHRAHHALGEIGRAHV